MPAQIHVNKATELFDMAESLGFGKKEEMSVTHSNMLVSQILEAMKLCSGLKGGLLTLPRLT